MTANNITDGPVNEAPLPPPGKTAADDVALTGTPAEVTPMTELDEAVGVTKGLAALLELGSTVEGVALLDEDEPDAATTGTELLETEPELLETDERAATPVDDEDAEVKKGATTLPLDEADEEETAAPADEDETGVAGNNEAAYKAEA